MNQQCGKKYGEQIDYCYDLQPVVYGQQCQIAEGKQQYQSHQREIERSEHHAHNP